MTGSSVSEVRRRRRGRPLALCGTPAAVRRHVKRSEELDEACRGVDDLAWQADERERWRRAAHRAALRGVAAPAPPRPPAPPREVPLCGTVEAAKRHYRRHESLDDACRIADNAHSLARYYADPDRLTKARAKAARARAKAEREGRKRQSPPRERPPLPSRICPVCRTVFTPKVKAGKYCDRDCLDVAMSFRRGGVGGLTLALRLASPEERDAIMARLVVQRQAREGAVRRRVRRGERYGSQHQLERRRRLKVLSPSDPCARCGLPLGSDVSLIDLDHDDDDPSLYLGLSHSTCNRGKVPLVEVLSLSG